MTAYLKSSDSRYVTGGDNGAHFDAMVKALDGKRVQLDCTDEETGKIIFVD
jgi:hypothetical protein